MDIDWIMKILPVRITQIKPSHVKIIVAFLWWQVMVDCLAYENLLFVKPCVEWARGSMHKRDGCINLGENRTCLTISLAPITFAQLLKTSQLVTSVTEGRTQKLPKNVLRVSKHTDMTIHWKGLEEHFLMVPLVFRGKSIFRIFLRKKTSVLTLRVKLLTWH
jgi:hypothetical protein